MASKESNDVTKTGPLSYKQLQAANLEAYALASQVSPFANLAKPSYISSEDTIYEGYEQSPIYQLTGGKDYWGNSYWDATSPNEEAWLNLSDARGENQPGWIQALNGVAKGVVLAGTTFIDGTLGLLTGIGQAIYNGASDDPNKHWYEGIWDNPVTQAMHEVNQLSEEYLPNYRTQAQQEAPWYSWDNLSSANFIFDTVVKNIGFMVGAAYSGGVYTKAIEWGAKAFNLLKFGKAATATLEAGLKAMQASRATRSTKALVGSFFNAQAEAVQEAYNSKQDFITVQNQKIENDKFEQQNQAILEFALNGGLVNPDGTPDTVNSSPELLAALNLKLADIDNATTLAKSEIEKLSENVGTMTGLLNIPVLWLSDIAMFGKMYAGGWKAARTQRKTVTRATKEATKEAKAAARNGDPTKLAKLKEVVERAEKTGFLGLTLAEKALVEEAAPHLIGPKLGTFIAATKAPFREFNEEMLQGAASLAASYHYGNEVDKIFNAALDIDSAEETSSVLGSIFKGLVSQYGDVDKYEEGFVGAITGLLGAPTFGRKRNSTDDTLGKGKWIGLTGGVFTNVRNYRAKVRRLNLAARDATEVLRNENLASNIKHLIAQTKFAKDMDRAIIHDDEKEYKDARTAAIFEMVNHLKRVNRLDLLQRAMGATTEFTDQDIAEIAEMVTKQVSATTPDIKEKIKKRDTLEKNIRDFSEKLSELFEEGDLDAYDQLYTSVLQMRDELDTLEAEINAAKPATLSPYIHEDGKTPFTEEEIKEDIQKRVLNFNKIIDTITLAQDEIDDATSGQLTNELLDTLTWYKVMMSDWAERSLGITKQWEEVIKRLASDPALRNAVKAATEVDDLLEEAGYDPTKAKIQFGGRFAQLKNIQNYANVLDLLQDAVDRGGLPLAYLLTSTLKLQSGQTVGEYLSKLFENVLNGDTLMTKDIKTTFLKNLEDLKSIGKGHRRYNELLEEYLSNPNKIDKVHQSSINKAQSESNKRGLTSVADDLDWNAPLGTIAKYLRNNATKIEEAGGLDEFVKNLTPEQKKKVKEALKLGIGIDSLDSLIDDSGLEDETAQILRGIIEEKEDDAETIEQLANQIIDEIENGAVEEAIRKLVPEEEEEFILRLIEASETAIKEFMDDNFDKLVKATEEAQRALDEEQERIKRDADRLKDEDEPSPEEAPEEKDTNEDELKEPKEEELFDEPSEEEKEVAPANPTTPGSVKEINKQNSRSPIAGQPGHNRRRQVSQFYLLGLDKETLPEHYENHPEDIPKGVDKEAFLKYIKAVNKYLTDKGAYTYISGVNPEYRLKKGDIIEFTTDKQLNEEAGVTVILMVTKDKDGKQQVIGSLPTSLDFQSVLRGGTKTLAELNPEDKALYDALCEELLTANTEPSVSYTGLISKTLDTIISIAEENEEPSDKYVKTHPDEEVNPITSPMASIRRSIDEIREILNKDSTSDEDAVKINRLFDSVFRRLKELIDHHTFGGDILLHDDTVKSVEDTINSIIPLIDSTLRSTRAKVSSITTKVENLRSGHPSFSALNRSVSEVFGDLDIPIAVVLQSGVRNSKAVKNPLLGDPKLGLVYIFVDSNTGTLIPLLCYSTNLKDLANNDWYVELTVAVIQKTVDELNLGSIKDELLRWLPFLTNLHINIITNDKTGQRSVLFGWGINKEGKIAQSYSIKIQSDNTISERDAKAFFSSIAGRKITLPSGEKRYPTTNVDRNKLDDKEYISNISRYIKVNVTPNSTRTIDDWFEYEATPLLKKGKKPSTVNPAVPSAGKKESTETVVTSSGEVEITSVGTVKNADNSLTPEQLLEIIEGTASQRVETSTNESTQDSVDDALKRVFGVSTSAQDDIPDTSRRRRRRRPNLGKTLLVSDTNDATTTLDQLLNDVSALEKMFPKLAKQGRVVLVDGLIKIIDENGNPRNAYGLFKNGIIYLSNQSPVGTAFHEAFHYVTDTLLDSSEKQTMFEEAAKLFGNLQLLELEEKLAESFREFMNERQDHSIKGRLNNIFLKLKHIVLSIIGRESYLDNLFWNIYRGKLQLKAIDNYYQRDATIEMQSIKDKAIADGTFMKAPNGNPTNLNERQWLQVRTKNFINWFGDWINNPKEASKVVDENGEPLVVYHGGQGGITTFLNRADNPDYGKTKHQGPLNRRYNNKDRVGIYFSKYKSVSSSYAGSYSKKNREVYEVFLNIKNPLEQKFLTTVMNRLTNVVKKEKNKKLDPALVLRNQLDTILQGHDGINHSKGEEFIIFDSNQVKSATSNSGAFSTTDNDIYDSSYKQELLEYKSRKLAYDNLDLGTRNYLEARKISKEEYEALNIELKEILLQCM